MSDRSAVTASVMAEVNEHPIWQCQLLRHCEAGHLTLADFAYVFSQYYRYSRDFTRYLAAVMVRCPSDYFRAKLAQNMWEEGGMLEAEQRHAEIFRDFLRRGLEVDPATIDFDEHSELFAQAYLSECLQRSPAGSSAFLAFGTEAIVARMYAIFQRGLEKVGLGEDVLRFFAIHVACDDEHAATLTDLTSSYAADPGWEHDVRSGARAALDLRLRFFDNLFEALARRRLRGLLENIQARDALPAPTLVWKRGQRGPALYDNRIDRLNVEFAVERVPFEAEVLDPRLVYIPPHRRNELHKHAHETVFVIVRGHGRVLVGERWTDVAQGDYAFVPRWAMHQTENTSDQEMVVLAITDYGLTGKAFLGNYLKTARVKSADSPSRS